MKTLDLRRVQSFHFGVTDVDRPRPVDLHTLYLE